MNTVVPLPVKPRPPRHRPLVCQGVYGRPGGDGLNGLVKLLIEFGLEELSKGNLDDQPPANPGALNQDATEEPVA